MPQSHQTPWSQTELAWAPRHRCHVTPYLSVGQYCAEWSFFRMRTHVLRQNVNKPEKRGAAAWPRCYWPAEFQRSSLQRPSVAAAAHPSLRTEHCDQAAPDSSRQLLCGRSLGELWAFAVACCPPLSAGRATLPPVVPARTTTKH